MDRPDSPSEKESTINRYVDEWFALDRFVEICHHGLHYGTQATGYVEIADLLADFRKKPSPFKDENQRDEARRHAERVEIFAKQEHGDGFPYLYSLATIRLWTILESAVDDFVLERLRTGSPEQFPALSKLKGALIAFMSASEAEKLEILLEKLKDSTDATIKKGVGRFEALLDPVGLSGAVPDCVRRVLVEISEVRNVVVHRNAVADKRFLESCPWFPVETGARVKLTHHLYRLYGMTVVWYLTEIANRLTTAEGRQVNESMQHLGETYLALIEKHHLRREKNKLPESAT